MDRFIRTLLIAGAILLFYFFGMPLLTGSSKKSAQTNLPPEVYVDAPDFRPDVLDRATGGAANPPPPEGDLCVIHGQRFEAELSSRGAAIRHVYLKDSQFQGTEAADVSTTPDHERWRSLRTLFRTEGAADQFAYDRFLWKLEKLGETGCRFSYRDDLVDVVKTVSAGTRPFELTVVTTVTNLSAQPKRHRYAIFDFAARRNAELKSGFGRASPFVTELSCADNKDVVRKGKDDFKEGWFRSSTTDRYAAVTNAYFAQVLVPQGAADCGLLAEERRALDGVEEHGGAVYHARLAYPARELGPGEKASYTTIGFFGPKDRRILGEAGGLPKGLTDLINLGFFSPVARVLVGVLVFFHEKVTAGNWGLAIILMTFALRMTLFPLTWMALKNTIAMRRIKPEMDELLKKFEGDPQAKNLAMMEFYRKKGVNPFGGCLPTVVQMPVWFAMFTTLQTAVELYHTKFLWFRDLTAPDPYFALPLVLGVFMIVQQRIVPMSGMDPVQQKMMTYVMPVLFTGMMLFLPAALALYSLTNSVLGIAQQLIVELVAPRHDKHAIVVKEVANEAAD